MQCIPPLQLQQSGRYLYHKWHLQLRCWDQYHGVESIISMIDNTKKHTLLLFWLSMGWTKSPKKGIERKPTFQCILASSNWNISKGMTAVESSVYNSLYVVAHNDRHDETSTIKESHVFDDCDAVIYNNTSGSLWSSLAIETLIIVKLHWSLCNSCVY